MGNKILLPIILNIYPYIKNLWEDDIMPKLVTDERRRITLPKGLVEPKQEFVAIKTKEGILLKPLPKDPIKTLQKEGEKLKGLSRKQLRKIAYEEAIKEAVK